MKILVSWLGDFIDLPGTPEELAGRMSVRGFAVEGIEHLAGGDAVIDIEVTANRPDCLSVGGFAREVATVFGVPVRWPGDNTPPVLSTEAADDLSVVIERPALCPRYAGAIADVTVGPSPDWMQARLRACGVRPTSNIVDITNYILLERGQPMHAFDHSKLEGGQIRVRTARRGETLRTLDGRVRELAEDMLVIADAARPVAVAGVMGGADSEVTGSTRTIVLESASFDPLSVRRTSKALGLKTEASIRFERGADVAQPARAMERACALLAQTGAGKARGTLVDCHPVRPEAPLVQLRRERLAGLVGTSVPDAEVRRILIGLGFLLHDAPGGWQVTVPSWRVDIVREVDLIEEVARHFGFEQIPVGFPHLASPPVAIDPQITDARRIRSLLTSSGFSEAVTFGFTAASSAEPFLVDDTPAMIKNPLSEAFAVLRPSLLPGLVESAGRNVRHGRRDVQLFEIGSRFTVQMGETRSVAFVWSGSGRPEHWSERPREVDFFDAAGVLSALAEAHDADLELEPVSVLFLAAGQAARVLLRPSGGGGDALAPAGIVGRLAPALGESLGLPSSSATFVAEVALEPLVALRRPGRKAVAPPRFPAVDRDISILVEDTTTSRAVRTSIESLGIPILASVREFDRYAGTGVPAGRISLSLRLTFRSPERTLTDEDVQQAMERVLETLTERHGAVQR